RSWPTTPRARTTKPSRATTRSRRWPSCFARGRRSKQMIKIEALSGQKRGTKVESETGVLRIGRADGNDLLLTDDHVSGDHARVQTSGETWVLHDLKSTNGT